jgi:hypothetical protein
LIWSVDAAVGDSEITVAGLSKRASASRRGSARKLDVREVDVERGARRDHLIRLLERRDELPDLEERAVGGGMQMREVDDRADPVEARRDLAHVLERPDLADATHHLDPERHRAVLGLEPLAQLAELLHDRVDRLLAAAAEQEARVEDDQLGSGRLGDSGRVVEHADGHVELLSTLGVAHEPGNRRVDRECNVMLGRELPERFGKLVVHPEPTFEVDLAGRETTLQKCVDRRIGRIPTRNARRAIVQVTSHEKNHVPGA